MTGKTVAEDEPERAFRRVTSREPRIVVPVFFHSANMKRGAGMCSPVLFGFMHPQPEALFFRRLVESVGVIGELCDDPLSLFFLHGVFAVLRLRFGRLSGRLMGVQPGSQGNVVEAVPLKDSVMLPKYHGAPMKLRLHVISNLPGMIVTCHLLRLHRSRWVKHW